MIVPRPVARRRRVWLLVHRWIGLGLGAMLTLLGLTGSINVFGRELDVALNPALFAATTTADPIGAMAALRIVKAAVPEPIRFIRAPDGIVPVWIGMFRRHGDLWTVDIDPGTGAVLGIRDIDASFTRIVYTLHSALLLRRWWGKQMVGVLGLVLLAMAISGLVLWWPAQGFWRTLFRLRTRPRQILYHDLHALVGVWGGLILLLVSVTGVGVVFPGLIRPAVRLASPVVANPRPALPDRLLPFAVDADQAIAIALKAAPGERMSIVAPPATPDNVWMIGLRWQTASPANQLAGRIWIDPWTGAIVADRSALAETGGERFMDMQLWLHNGSMFGWTGRILVFLGGLSLPTLFVSGLLLWLRKRRNRRQVARQRVAALAA
ncbi:MAG: PepSY-associated TM helix domain-containing protein [Janthinobacterium lividum]